MHPIDDGARQVSASGNLARRFEGPRKEPSRRMGALRCCARLEQRCAGDGKLLEAQRTGSDRSSITFLAKRDHESLPKILRDLARRATQLALRRGGCRRPGGVDGRYEQIAGAADSWSRDALHRTLSSAALRWSSTKCDGKCEVGLATSIRCGSCSAWSETRIPLCR